MLRLKFLILFSLFITVAHATTVTVHLFDPSTAAVNKNAFVRFELKNYGLNVPRTASNVIVPSTMDVYPNISGLVTVTIQGTNTITPTSVYYTVSYFKSGTRYYKADYDIKGATYNLDTATPITTYPVIIPPTGDTTYLRTDSGNTGLTSNYPFTFGNVNNIRYANAFPGATAGAKIVAAITDLPDTGGTVDARGLEGPQIISQNIFAGVLITQPITLLLGNSVLSVSTTQAITASGSRILGAGQDPHENGGAGTISKGTVFKWTGAANGIVFTATDVSCLQLKDFVIDGNNLASIGISVGSPTAHPQFEIFDNIRTQYMKVNGTDAALDLTGGMASGVADSDFYNMAISGGAVAVKIQAQQLRFHGGAIGADAPASALVELGNDANVMFYGTGFYGNADTVFGLRGSVGIDGLQTYGGWAEGQKCWLKKLDGGPVVSAWKISFYNPRISLTGGTRVIDLTNLNANVNWIGGYNDNTAGITEVYVSSGSSFRSIGAQSGGLTYAGTGKLTILEETGWEQGISGQTSKISSDGLTTLVSTNATSPTPSFHVSGGANALFRVETTGVGNNPGVSIKNGTIDWLWQNQGSTGGSPFILYAGATPVIQATTAGAVSFPSAVLGSASGGTANGFTKFIGPTAAEKTFTLPDASATILTSNAPVSLAQGGAGLINAATQQTVATNGTEILTGACQAQTALSITGVVATSKPFWSLPNAPAATWQTGITVILTAGAGTVTPYLCNPTAGSITPAAQVLNIGVLL